jgi:predicted XRE-type DNA-binding protein
MALKAELAAQIAGLIRKQGLTQVQAAAKLGLTQPKISALLKGQFRGISERRLLDCLTHLGRDVQIVVKPSRSTGEGRLTVRIA